MSKCFDKLSALARLCHKLYDLPAPFPAFGHFANLLLVKPFRLQIDRIRDTARSLLPLLPANPFETRDECKSMDPFSFFLVYGACVLSAIYKPLSSWFGPDFSFNLCHMQMSMSRRNCCLSPSFPLFVAKCSLTLKPRLSLLCLLACTTS